MKDTQHSIVYWNGHQQDGNPPEHRRDQILKQSGRIQCNLERPIPNCMQLQTCTLHCTRIHLQQQVDDSPVVFSNCVLAPPPYRDTDLSNERLPTLPRTCVAHTGRKYWFSSSHGHIMTIVEEHVHKVPRSRESLWRMQPCYLHKYQ